MGEATLQTFRLIIEYDGSAFHGWQRQKKDRTVQETIEKALAVMTREKVTVIGSGRTDAGVHALGQVASFRTRSRLDAEVFVNGLNSLLPGDVVVRACDPMPDSFHARFDVTVQALPLPYPQPVHGTGHRPAVRLAHPQAAGHGGNVPGCQDADRHSRFQGF